MNKQKKLPVIMYLGSKPKEERRRRVGVEYEDWAPMDHWGPYMPTTHDLPTAPMSYYDERIHSAYPMGEPESRRYSDGHFAPRSDYNNPWMDHRMTPTYDDRGERRMNPIGFARDMGGSDATVPQYHEMERMDGDGMLRGYSRSEYMPRFDRQMAEEWASGMENGDGTRGPHWTLDQAKQVMAQKEIGGPPLEFWLTLNMMYSDYCKVAKKLGVNTVDFYACMAEAFLNDKDAVGGGGPEKLAAYYNAVVQH